MTASQDYVWVSLDPASEDSGGLRILAKTRLRSLGPTLEEAAVLYQCLSKDRSIEGDVAAALEAAELLDAVHSRRRVSADVAVSFDSRHSDEQEQIAISLLDGPSSTGDVSRVPDGRPCPERGSPLPHPQRRCQQPQCRPGSCSCPNGPIDAAAPEQNPLAQ